MLVTNEDVANADVLPAELPTKTYPSLKEAVKLPERYKLPSVLTSIPIELPKPSCNVVSVDVAELSVPK
jgi:hypothetical protein